MKSTKRKRKNVYFNSDLQERRWLRRAPWLNAQNNGRSVSNLKPTSLPVFCKDKLQGEKSTESALNIRWYNFLYLEYSTIIESSTSKWLKKIRKHLHNCIPQFKEGGCDIPALPYSESGITVGAAWIHTTDKSCCKCNCRIYNNTAKALVVLQQVNTADEMLTVWISFRKLWSRHQADDKRPRFFNAMQATVTICS